jgi:hypothetical protein
MSNLKSRSLALVAAAVAFSPVAVMAQATQTFDASTYAPQILGTIAGLLVIGGAVFAVHLAIKSTKWARKAT